MQSSNGVEHLEASHVVLPVASELLDSLISTLEAIGLATSSAMPSLG
jgi:hypothetical protein